MTAHDALPDFLTAAQVWAGGLLVWLLAGLVIAAIALVVYVALGVIWRWWRK